MESDHLFGPQLHLSTSDLAKVFFKDLPFLQFCVYVSNIRSSIKLRVKTSDYNPKFSTNGFPTVLRTMQEIPQGSRHSTLATLEVAKWPESQVVIKSWKNA